jgi:ribosomal protein L11 methyltransferase
VEELPGTFDVVMANLQAQPLIHLAAALKDKLARGGQLVLSGILNGQQQPIATAYRAQGLVPAAERSSGEWCLLHFSRDAS